MNKKSAIPWWGGVAWLIAAIVGLIAYRYMPDRVPLHFNAAGEADRYGSPLEAVAVVPAVMLGIMLLWQVLWRIDPRKRNYESFWPTYRYTGGIIIIFIGIIHLLLIGEALDLAQFSVIRILPTAIGLLIMLLSNVFPRLQPNWWLGIRTAWTLSSEESWTRTHRLAGHLGIPAGIIAIVLGWTLPTSLVTFAILVPILGWALISVVASYFYAK